jgi:hypothetical protein
MPRSNIRPLNPKRRGSSVVEQGTHKPLVAGSTPALGTRKRLESPSLYGGLWTKETTIFYKGVL